MKIEYIKKIHKEEGKQNKFTFSIVNGDHVFQYCCKKAKDASEEGFFEVAYNTDERADITWEQRREEERHQDKPLICMVTNEVGGCDDVERKLYPIDKCPFCGADNEIILVKIKEITHIVTKKLIPAREEEVTSTQEKIIFDKNLKG